jgi:hypothetical protein
MLSSVSDYGKTYEPPPQDLQRWASSELSGSMVYTEPLTV